MPIDPYAPCPCGSGKKLKFCCSDVIGDLERIHRMIEGEQPRAALRHIENVLSRFPERPSIMALKADLEISLDDYAAAAQTVEQFIAVHPDSPIAHACRAIVLAKQEGRSRDASDALQQALSLLGEELPDVVFEAMGAVGAALLSDGHFLAAQAVLWLNANVAPADDNRARELLVGLNRYSRLPLLLRDQHSLRDPPDNAPWKAEADRAAKLADGGQWREAAQIVERLGQQFGAEPALVYNRALLGGRLADEQALVAGLHGFAMLDVPLEDAVEAEATAQLLDPNVKDERIDSVVCTFSVADIDLLVVRLSAAPKLHSFNLDPAIVANADQPPPRHTYLLLDRAPPPSGRNVRREEVPRFVGVIAVFGRQTDRAERLELTTDKGSSFTTAIDGVKSIAGDAIGDMTEERVVGSISARDEALGRRWYFPPDTPPHLQRRAAAEEGRAVILERWPDLPSPALGGKTPRQAAGDPSLRIRLLAAILILEQGTDEVTEPAVFNELRASLGLPASEEITADGQPVQNMPLVRVPRLKLDQIADDDLVMLYRRAVLVAADAALLHVGAEAVRRPSLAERIPPRDAYRRMIAAESDPDRALALISAARQATAAAGKTNVTWDLAELEEHISAGNIDQAQSMLQYVLREYADRQDTAEELFLTLRRIGLLRESDFSPDDEEGEFEPAPAMAAGPEETTGRIWTPDSDRPAGGKSPLWTPS